MLLPQPWYSMLAMHLFYAVTPAVMFSDGRSTWSLKDAKLVLLH